MYDQTAKNPSNSVEAAERWTHDVRDHANNIQQELESARIQAHEAQERVRKLEALLSLLAAASQGFDQFHMAEEKRLADRNGIGRVEMARELAGLQQQAMTAAGQNLGIGGVLRGR